MQSFNTRTIQNQHQLINSHARPFQYSVLPHMNVALLCLLDCFCFIFLFCSCIYVVTVFSLNSMFMTYYLGLIICHLIDKNAWGNIVPFNLSGFCFFNIGIALKSLFKKSLCYYVITWCFSKKYLDLKTALPLFYVNVLLFKKRQIYIYIRKRTWWNLNSEWKKDVNLAVFIFDYKCCLWILFSCSAEGNVCGFCKCRREPWHHFHHKPSLLCSFQWVWPTQSRLELLHVTLPAAGAA